MSALLRLSIVLLALAAAAATSSTAFAQDAEVPSKEEQVRRVRELPEEEKQRLFEALQRFRAMPPERRDALRRKAREVGVERLGEIAGRDFDALRSRHRDLRSEMEEIEKMLGEERVASLSPDERAWLRFNATRGYRNHVRLRMLEEVSLAQGFEPAAPEEKRRRVQKGAEVVLAKMFAEKAPEEQARLRALPAPERAEVRSALLREWRLRQTTDFVKRFDSVRFAPYLKLTPERRAAEIDAWKRRARWFQIAEPLRREGVTPEAIRMLGHLGPDERAQVLFELNDLKNLSAADRRARIEKRIRELHGAGSLDTERARRPLPRVRELLRERALRTDPDSPAESPR